MKHTKIKNLFLSLCYLSFTLILAFTPQMIATAKASKYTNYTYAQIKEETYLYKTSKSTQIQNALFMLPNSYFVKLLSNISEDFYKAEYNGIVGYVLKSQVMPVSEKPQNPYLKNITFRVYSSDGTKIFSSPTNTASSENKIVEEVEVLSALTYYGEILGDEFIPSRGYSWIYCKTQNNNFGYIYKGLCDNFSPITQNQEKVTYTTNVYFESDNSYLYNLVNVTPQLKVLLILTICIPSILLIYLLFKPFKLEKQTLTTQANHKPNKNKNLNQKEMQNKNSAPAKKSWIKILKDKLFKTNTSYQQAKNKPENKNQRTNNKYANNKNINNYKNSNKRSTLPAQNKTLETIQKIIDDEPL